MIINVTQSKQKRCRHNERGAALVTVLMISSLLLVAATALLLEASMNTANITDATAEEQAYYAAESGIQTVVNVLRGNTIANTLIDPSESPTSAANRIDYLKAIKLNSSNKPGDTAAEARLSRWISYDNTFNDRVVLGTAAYTKRDGFAFKVAVENPDNPDHTISYNTSGKIDNESGSKTWTGSDSALTIQYQSTNVTNLNVLSGTASTDCGKFIIIGSGTIPTRVRFTINVNMTKPYAVTKVIRGFIEAGTVTGGSVGTVKIFYDSQVFIMMGSEITLSGGMPVDQPFRVGYEVTPNAPGVQGGETKVAATITEPEPLRLIIRSTGFGPRGAVKQLEAIIQNNYFNGLSAPSPLMLVGPNNGLVFKPGNSATITYSGKDVARKTHLPPVGTTGNDSLSTVKTELNNFKGSVIGTVSNVEDEMPFWLQSPENLDATVQNLKNVALASGRYFPAGVTPPNFGNNANATGITFVDGNISFSGAGGGILIVTGNLTFDGAVSFNGLILVTGPGGLNRNGGGNGILQGNIVVAPYTPSNLAGGFLSPKYDISGGGNSEVVFNSESGDKVLGALSNFVKGVAEK